jgi:predicted permease
MLLNRARLWARSIVLRRRLEREMQAEMAEHLRQSAARLEARGLSAADARRAARREFGNVAYLQEEARDARGAGWLDALAADARFALRHFARKPGTTLTMLLVLVAGLSISTLLFSYVYAYALQPPPGVTLEDDLVRIRGTRDAGAAGRLYRTFTEEELLEYRKLTGVFASVAGWTDAATSLALAGDAERRGLESRVTFVTENYFSVLGVRPALGPGLPAVGADDPTTAAVAVIGHIAWDQLFGKSPSAIGATLVVNGVPVTIVGVAPEKFIGFPGYSRFQLWMPVSARRLLLSELSGEFRAIGRLRAGVDERAASAAVAAVAARSTDRVEEIKALEPSADVVPLLAANSDPMFDRDVTLMSASVGLVGLLVLLVTCTNVSALLTGLATARRQEIAIRLSLGAARARLIRQLLTESALLGVAAGAGALGIVWLALRAATTLIAGLPFEVAMHWSTITFTFGVALGVGTLFGLSPALHATRLGLASALRDSAGSIAASRGRLQRGLVTAQIAFTQPLIVLLAAVMVFLLKEFDLRPTQNADRLITVTVRPSSTITGSTPAASKSRQQLRVAMRRLRDRLEAEPGVETAVLDWGGGPSLGSYVVHPDDRVAGIPQNAVGLSGEHAAQGYFGAMGVPVVRGRDFAATEVTVVNPRTLEAPVIIGADLARRLWAGADAVGRRLQATSDSTAGARTLVVVGVIDDPNSDRRKEGEDFPAYLPPDTAGAPNALLLRMAGLAQSHIPALRQIAQAEAPDMAVRIRTLYDIESQHLRRYRLITSGLTAAGMAALLLSAIGLYAVVAFSVGQRTREIAVRMAVGARGQQIVRRFVTDGLRLSAIGVVLGLPISLLGLRALMSAVEDIRPVPLPWVAAIAAVGVALVATAAAWIPARRAAAVDPAITLRSD